MKASEFMDKQVMELSRSHSDDFSQDSYDDDDFASSFQFRPVRHVASQQSRVENCSSSEDSALISVIDRKMKQHSDNLLHAVEGLSARVSQLETRFRLLENSIDDLKDSTEINYGRTDGKLREIENILRKVEGGMQDLRDKREISEAQLHLAKLQMLKGHQQLENQKSNVQTIPAEEVLSSASQQNHQPHSTHSCLPLPSLPPSLPPTLPHQHLPPAPAAQIPTQTTQNQIPFIQQADSNYLPPLSNQQSTPQMYYMSQVQQSQPPPTAPYQPYPPVPHLSQTSQFLQLPQMHPPFNAVDPQAQGSLIHNSGETSYMLSQSYPPSIHETSHAPDLALPSQEQYVGSLQSRHDQSTSNNWPEFSPGHMQPVQHSSFDDFYSQSGSPSHYSGSKMKHSQVLPSSLAPYDRSNFSRLPTAQVLPYALPMASSVDKESGSGGTGNSVPINNVIDKVVAMGFRRDMVTATVRKMTENGQSVDLNVVLDKLMNNGEVQPRSGGFGR